MNLNLAYLRTKVTVINGGLGGGGAQVPCEVCGSGPGTGTPWSISSLSDAGSKWAMMVQQLGYAKEEALGGHPGPEEQSLPQAERGPGEVGTSVASGRHGV